MLTLQAAADQYIVAYTGIKKRELDAYRYTFRSLIDYIGSSTPIQSITITTLRNWRATLSGQTRLWENHPTRPTVARPLSPHTIHGHVRRVRRFFAWLVEEELLDKSPARRLELPKLQIDPADISDDDINRLIGAAKTPRDRALIMMLAESGCRVGGVAGLTMDRLNMPQRKAQVIEKGEKRRNIYFSRATAHAIDDWLEIRPDNKGNNVFVGKKGNLTISGVYQILKRTAKLAGVRRFNPHSFRHAIGRYMLHNGASIEDIAAVLGHSSAEITKLYYAPWNDAEIQKRHQRYATRFDT